jgi:catechol 2,3-dioxygenase-like lactoylglutathione lyase family enzyme
MKVHYLGPIVSYVRDLEKSLVFYQNLFGFEQVGECSPYVSDQEI